MSSKSLFKPQRDFTPVDLAQPEVNDLVSNILDDKPHQAVALNGSRKKSSDRQLGDAVVQLRVAGLPLQSIDPYQL